VGRTAETPTHCDPHDAAIGECRIGEILPAAFQARILYESVQAASVFAKHLVQVALGAVQTTGYDVY
jgi:hypothetical protein